MKVFEFNPSQGSLRDHVSNTIPINTNVVIRRAKKGRTVYFDGSANLNFGDLSNLDFGTGDFSISLIAKIKSEISTILNKHGDGSNPGFNVQNINGVIRFRINDGTGQNIDTLNNYDGLYHHILITADRDGSATIYVDNASENSANISARSGSINNANNFYLGNSQGGTTGVDGYENIIKLYNHILDAAEQEKLWQEFLNARVLHQPIILVGSRQYNRNWEEVAPKLGAETRIFSLAVHNGRLFGGTYPNGKLYRWNESNAWEEVAPKLGDETSIYSIAVHNGRLFGGTYPNGKLHRWNESNAWEEVAPKLGDETRIFSLAVHNGRLFGGTSPNGKLYRAKMPVGTDEYPYSNVLINISGRNWDADGTTQTVKIGDFRIASGSFKSLEDSTGKYIECVTNGSLLVNLKLSEFAGNGYIQRIDGDLSSDAGGTVDAASNVAHSGNVTTITMTAGQKIRNLTITKD
jgi:hypothetical protein